MLAFGDKPITLLGQPPEWLEPTLNRFGPVAGFVDLREEIDALLFELIAERRAEPGERDDVLSMLLEARHEDGSPMSEQELRDELLTLLIAGHETTATTLAWAFERLVREPAVLGRLVDEIDADDGDEYLTATIRETLRRRPVLPNNAPRLVAQPIEVGGWHYEPGVCLVPNAYLVHHDPDVYPDPYAFRPERFLDEKPGTYTWIPFGGGRRRCLGASFALLEMRIVLAGGARRLRPAAGRAQRAEPARRRNITVRPARRLGRRRRHARGPGAGSGMTPAGRGGRAAARSSAELSEVSRRISRTGVDRQRRSARLVTFASVGFLIPIFFDPGERDRARAPQRPAARRRAR